ncbi:hypothetical protein [Allosphingosinicella indica]|uniref:Uncharacterized protein n=1 Tax=Allosphingosinicella indica TaxID=941907 RepID=A0A1X7FZW8_9SPHN|nr:hypothetical protein [Allosphingosinicella indica]SMF61645.1 hypothetical protein SAMN06295910_0637 [Allosphingosinicella indica]
MSKPPATGPNSDVDGVHEDRHDVVDAANAAGQTAADLKHAQDQSKGRPQRSHHSQPSEENKDDRAR